MKCDSTGDVPEGRAKLTQPIKCDRFAGSRRSKLAGVFLGRQRAKAPVEGMQSLSDPAFHGALRELKPEKIKLHVGG